MSKEKNHMTATPGERATELLHKLARDAATFRPDELTPEEEEFAKREALTALNYVPEATIQKQSELMRAPQKPRPFDIRRELRSRFSGFGFTLWLMFLIFPVTWAIIDTHGWPMGVFSCLLMTTVLELSYRLSVHR